jgi:integrase
MTYGDFNEIPMLLRIADGRLIDVKFRFDKAKKEARIRDFRFHDLRHTAATRMADGGADAEQLKIW